MNRVNFFKKIYIPILALILFITLVPLSTSCSITATFGNLIICESVNKDTAEPVNAKSEFDLFTKEINATINVQNIKGSDNYRFLWKNNKTGAVITDMSGKYQPGKTEYGSGWFSSKMSVQEGKAAAILPGDYTVEFYHNGELKSTASFKVNKPEVKILQVSLTNKVNDKAEPVNITQEFGTGEKIYACVQTNYLVPGDIYKAKWYDEKNNIINETSISIKDEDTYGQPSWIAFSGDKPIPAGKNKVEIYLNDVKFNEYSFTITDTKKTQIGAITFDKGNIFAEAQSKYFFTIKYPDNCEYTWQEDTTGMNVQFNPLNKNDGYSTMMMVLNEGSAPKAADYTAFADKIASVVASSAPVKEQIGERVVAEGKLLDGTPFKEYTYYFNDKDKLEYGLFIDLIPKFGNLYVWYGFAVKPFYGQLNASSKGSLESLVLKK